MYLRLVAPILLVVLVIAAACGGEDEGSLRTSTATTTPTERESTPTEPESTGTEDETETPEETATEEGTETPEETATEEETETPEETATEEETETPEETATEEETETPEVTSTETPDETATETATELPTSLPGGGLFDTLGGLSSAEEVEAPTVDTETRGIYVSDGERVISIPPIEEEGSEIHAVASPDGRWLATGGFPLGLTRTEIATGDAVWTGRLDVLGDYGSGILIPCDWLPDSSALLFTFRREGSFFAEGAALHNFDTEETTILDQARFESEEGLGIQECPDVNAAGTFAVWVEQVGGEDNQLFVANLDGSPANQLTDAEGLFLNAPAIITPDGNAAVVQLYTDEPPAPEGSTANVQYDVGLFSGETSETTNLTGDPAYDILPSLSPDGVQIAFVSDRDGTQAVYTMAEGGAPVQVAVLEGEEPGFALGGMSWSPDGTRMAVTLGGSGEANTYLVDIASGAVTLLGTRSRFDWAPRWLPDSSGVLY